MKGLGMICDVQNPDIYGHPLNYRRVIFERVMRDPWIVIALCEQIMRGKRRSHFAETKRGKERRAERRFVRHEQHEVRP